MALPRVQSDDAANESTQAALAALRSSQAQARFPRLLTGFKLRSSAYHQRESGLISVAMLHSTLTQAELAEIGAFRLAQYALCGWYDLQRIVADQAKSDPLMEYLPPGALHVFTGTEEGAVLAYGVIQGVNATSEEESVLMEQQGFLTLADSPRPLFASERELFGPACFSTLPALRCLPLTQVGELNCLLTNQSLQSAASTVAAVETLLLLTQYLLTSENGFQAVLGASDGESRRLLAALGFPVLYAPEARIVVPFLPYKRSYWASGEIGEAAQGKYWPFAVAVEDLKRQRQHIEYVQQALSGSPQTIRKTLVTMRHQITRHIPSAFVSPAAPMWQHIP